VDTLIFLLIFGTLLAMRGRKRSVAVGLFLVSVLATMLLFGSHITSSLNLNF
jgi:hypothetical protein